MRKLLILLVLLVGCGGRPTYGPPPPVQPTRPTTTLFRLGVECRTEDGHVYRTGKGEADSLGGSCAPTSHK